MSRYFRPLLAVLIMLALMLLTLPVRAESADIMPMKLQEFPDDVKAVATAVINTMRHHEIGIPHVEFADKAKIFLREPGFDYKGFRVTVFSVVEYREAGKDRKGRILTFTLRFEDSLGRNATLMASAIYRLVDSGLRIESTAIREMQPAKPTVQLFAVPARKFPKRIGKAASSFTDLYRFVVKNAVPLSKTSKIPKAKQRYIIVAFGGERLLPGARLDLLLDTQAEGMSGSSNGMRTLGYQGWPVVTLPVSLALRKAPAYFLKVVYTPATSAVPGNREPQLLASYATSDGPSAVAQAAPGTSTAAVASDGVAAVNSAATQAAPLPKIDGSWHVESEFGFKMMVPKGWRSQALQDGTDRVLTVLSPDGNVAARVRAIPIQTGVPLQKVVDAFEQYVLGGGKRLARQNDTLNGMRGMTSVYSGDYEGTPVGMGMFATLQGRYAYILWGMIPMPYFDQRSAEVDAILNSFTLM